MSRIAVSTICFIWFVLAIVKDNKAEDVIVMIADWNGPIHKINKTDNSRTILYKDKPGIESMAYDPILEHLYWSNIQTHSINRVNLDGANFNKVSNAPKCQGMAMDHVNRLFFYSDDTEAVVRKLDMSTNETTIILKKHRRSKPHALVADCMKKYIYVSVIGVVGWIERWDYNGQKSARLRRTISVTSMAIDDTGTMLFWVDTGFEVNKVMSLDFTSREPKPVNIEGSIYKPAALDVLDSYLYIIDLNQKAVYLTLPKVGGPVTTNPLPGGMNPRRQIRVIKHPFECPNFTYGPTCASTCGHCNIEICSKIDGHCPKNCSAGWFGDLCDQECKVGSFGVWCSSTCGHCKTLAGCNKASGHCEDGCQDGWVGDSCTQYLMYVKVKKGRSNMWIGIGVGLLLLVIGLFAVAYMKSGGSRAAKEERHQLIE